MIDPNSTYPERWVRGRTGSVRASTVGAGQRDSEHRAGPSVTVFSESGLSRSGYSGRIGLMWGQGPGGAAVSQR